VPRSKVKEGFNRRWFMHPQWKDANQACIHATGMGLYSAWNIDSGCTNYNAVGWMTYGKVAEAIVNLVLEVAVNG
tara:strand:+ start:216 stop:440 length:225 start_codon:yes stop_codon:yes gene_type:complete